MHLHLIAQNRKLKTNFRFRSDWRYLLWIMFVNFWFCHFLHFERDDMSLESTLTAGSPWSDEVTIVGRVNIWTVIKNMTSFLKMSTIMFKLNKTVAKAPSVIPCFTLSVIKPHCFNDCHHCTGFDNENDDNEDEWLGFPTDCDFVSQRFGSGSFELEKCYFAIHENRNVVFL